MIVCVAANPSVDKLFVVDHLAAGEIHRPSALTRVPGGKGLNAARAAAAVGGEVTAVAILGGHNGRWIGEALAAEGVPLRAVRHRGESRHSLSVYDRACGELTEFYEPGDPTDEAEWRRLERLTARALDGARWMAVAGSLPPGAPEDGYARLVALARRRDVRSAVDADGAALAAALAERPDLVKVNEREAAGALGAPAEGREAALEAAGRLRSLAGPGGAAAVTRGPEGAALAAPGGRWHATLGVRGPFGVGSGDSFLGGMLVALDADAGWREALAAAVGAGAANAEEPGAGRLHGERARELAARVVVETAG